jgi:hypothetical protein
MKVVLVLGAIRRVLEETKGTPSHEPDSLLKRKKQQLFTRTAQQDFQGLLHTVAKKNAAAQHLGSFSDRFYGGGGGRRRD